jgi:hypothetical protein
VGLGDQLVAGERQRPLMLASPPRPPPSPQERIEQQMTGDPNGGGDRFDQLAHQTLVIIGSL